MQCLMQNFRGLMKIFVGSQYLNFGATMCALGRKFGKVNHDVSGGFVEVLVALANIRACGQDVADRKEANVWGCTRMVEQIRREQALAQNASSIHFIILFFHFKCVFL